MPGPAPKPAEARRNRNATTASGFKRLPHEGYTGPIPEWPLSMLAKDDEHTLWLKLWRLPQAIMWTRMHCEDMVALYVRAIVEAQGDPANTKLLAEVRQLDSKIGLSPKALLDLRWEIDDAPDEADDGVPANGNVTHIRTFVPANGSAKIGGTS